MASTQHRNTVQLAIYDLSRGMAGALSTQFLGISIPMIPHTAILVFGKEYFFSGTGIQKESPTQFRQNSGLQPVQMVTLGNTTVTPDEFHRWCNTQDLFTDTSYDFFRRNCNNFSDHAARNGLQVEGIPSWIVELPGKVLSTPMGRTVFESFFQGQGTGFDPMTYGGGGGLSRNTASNTSSPGGSVLPNQTPNPWADIGESTTSSLQRKDPPKPRSETIVDTPLLNSQNKLLLSTDKSSVKLCIKKLNTSKMLSEVDKIIHLAALENEILASSVSSSTVENTLFKVLEGGEETVMIYTLMILRLVVLCQCPKGSNIAGETNSEEKKEEIDSILCKCLQMVSLSLLPPELHSTSDQKSARFTTTPTRSMGWCILSNAFSNSEKLTLDFLICPQKLEQIIDLALSNTSSSEPVGVRQAASAFLYNFFHHHFHSFSASHNNDNSDDLPDWIVNSLCGLLQDIDEDKDEVTQFRRILIVAYIVKTYGRRAGSLVVDLGFGDVLKEVGKNGKKNGTLAIEVAHVIQASL